MTSWIDMAGIVFACTAVNHLGLIQAVEERIDKSIPIVNCHKCLSFWATLAYCIATSIAAQSCIATVRGGSAAALVLIGLPLAIHALAISSLAAWLSIWLDLLMGIIDKIYIHIYEKTYPNPDNDHALATNTDNGNPEDSLP